MTDFIKYMNDSVQNIVREAIKIGITRPKVLKYLNSFRGCVKKAEEKRLLSEQQGVHIPPFLICSITTSCNLFCSGCYARADSFCAGKDAGVLPAQRWDEIFTEAADMGISFVLLAGGEPFLHREVLSIAGEHTSLMFPVFTNGTMIDETALQMLDDCRNIVPVISLEGKQAQTDLRRGDGVYEQLTETMKKLKAKGILFGVSLTVTKNNIEEITEDGFIKGLKKAGAAVVFYIEYVPVDQTSRALAPGEEERTLLEQRMHALRARHALMILAFPGDEKYSGGCLAAGRGFVHINANGSVEPCPFSPFS
ncbi:MAG: radical SAM protein, partial [Clostridiales bacterium 43-6]